MWQTCTMTGKRRYMTGPYKLVEEGINLCATLFYFDSSIRVYVLDVYVCEYSMQCIHNKNKIM